MHVEDEVALLKITGQKILPRSLVETYRRCQRRFHMVHNGPFAAQILALICEISGCDTDPLDKQVSEPVPELVAADGQVNWSAQPAGVPLRYGTRTGKLIGAPDADGGTLRVMFDDGEENWKIPLAKCSLLGLLDNGPDTKGPDSNPAFAPGTRVKASTRIHGMREGTVEGISRDGKVKVLFDGNKAPARIKSEHVEALEPQLVS
jgi:hypothetical protein